MPALISREQARRAAVKAFMLELARIIPPDQAVPLKGAKFTERLGEPVKEDAPTHPRRMLHQNVGYFTKHQEHMNYPEYRRRDWPIGSGVVESGVKQFNKRVKGSDQFWNEPTLEPILALRGLWLSQDQRWDRYWSERTAYQVAA